MNTTIIRIPVSALNRILMAGLCGWLAYPCQAVEFAAEEFNGPFSSWADVKRDYGAVGDGKADDTAALQKALDSLTKHTNFSVLCFPAGTYRITGTSWATGTSGNRCFSVRASPT